MTIGISVVIIVTLMIAYLFMKDSSELWSLKTCLNEVRRKLPKEERKKLEHVNIHLTDTSIGYCINGKDIGIYKTYGKRYNVTQRDVLLHEISHILSGETQHTKKFWEYFRYLKSL